MLKACVSKQEPLGIIQRQEIYDMTRASVRGGLSNPFQPYARANNAEMGEEFDSSEPVSHICKFDVNSQYPTVVSRPLPADGGRLLDLPAEKKQHLKLLYELLQNTDFNSKDYVMTHLVKVTYYVPPEAHDFVDWAPPARMRVDTSELSEYSQELMRRRGWNKAPGNLKLMPFLGPHVEETLQLRLLKFYMETLQVRVCEVHAVIVFKCRPFMRPFIEECYGRRLALKHGGRKLQANVLKDDNERAVWQERSESGEILERRHLCRSPAL